MTNTTLKRIIPALALFAASLLAASGPAFAQAAPAWPGRAWTAKAPAEVGVDPSILQAAVAYAAPRGGSGIVVRNGYRIAYWGDQAARYHLYSATKSVGSILLGLAIADGRLRLDQSAQAVLPGLGLEPASNVATGWLPLVTIEQLATHTAGFDKPGGLVPLLFQPGTAWGYSDAGANWLADVVTAAYRQDLLAVLASRVLRPLQISATDLTWRQNRYRPRTLLGVPRREFGAGVYANVGAMARIGLMMARGGRWRSAQVLPAAYVAAAGSTPASVSGVPLRDPALYPGATAHYGLLWWNNASGALAGLPRDAFWAWGIDGQLILAVPSLDLVAARAGPRLGRNRFGDVATLAPFFGPLGRSVVPVVANAAPVVSVGPDSAATTGLPVALSASVADDGLPAGAALAYAWSVVSGPGAVAFSAPGQRATTATFAAAGAYVIRLAASEGRLAGQDDLVVTVADPAAPAPASLRASRRTRLAEPPGGR